MDEEMEIRDEIPTADELRAAAAEARANPLYNVSPNVNKQEENVTIAVEDVNKQTVIVNGVQVAPSSVIGTASSTLAEEFTSPPTLEIAQTQSNPLKPNEKRLGAAPIEVKNTQTPPLPLKVTERDSKGRIVKSEGVRIIKPESRAGRKPVITDEVLADLRQAFLMGFNDEEAAEYVNIARSTLSDYKAKHPEFADEVLAWKTNPMAKAKTTIYNNLSDPRIAAWYAERKAKDEFSTRSEVTGKDGEDLPPIKIEYVRPTDQIRTSKDPLRSDSETGSSLEPVDGSSN